MTKILRGKVVGDEIKKEILKKVEKLKEEDKIPALAMVRLGENPGDISYEKSIIKNCESLGIRSRVVGEKDSIGTKELVETIEKLNNDNDISGILIFRPLPKEIDEVKINNAIDPNKDVDCMHPLNLEKVFEGDMTGFVPCTPKSAMEILNYYDIELEGKDVLVINRSMVVGKPLAMMLLEENATVTIAHSRTKNLQEIAKRSDVVVTALGKAKFLGEEYFTKDSIVIDVGVSLDDNKKISGDADYDNLIGLVDMITPVPAGVGSVTTSILLRQVVLACEKRV